MADRISVFSLFLLLLPLLSLFYDVLSFNIIYLITIIHTYTFVVETWKCAFAVWEFRFRCELCDMDGFDRL